jgi:hypothetical protein
MAFYEHKQDAPATTWTINHNLGKVYVNIDVVIAYQGFIQTVQPQSITLTDANTAVVTFSQPHAGVARVGV